MFEFKPIEAKGATRVIKGGLLIDGNGGKPVKDPVIIVEGRRIKQVGTGLDGGLSEYVVAAAGALVPLRLLAPWQAAQTSR